MKFTTVLLASVALVGSVSAQLDTTTLPWDNGDTVIVSGTTNALGATTYVTLSTLTGDDTATATATTTSRTTTATTAKTTAKTKTTGTTTAGVAVTTTAAATTDAEALYTTNVQGVSVTFQSGTQLAYSQWSALVEPSLSAAYYATAKSSASTRITSFLPSVLVGSSLALAAVGGLVGVAQVML